MNAFEWATAKIGATPEEEVYCQTRDVAQARVERLGMVLTKTGWSEDHAPLVTSIMGELAGNCFDHNLGQWNDVPGCWFEYKVVGDVFTAEIADRGQGILHSLQKVRPQLLTDIDALHVAFTEQLSGRAPENRGNGLKFVVRSLTKLASPHFIFHSGNATITLTAPIDTKQLKKYITSSTTIVPGTHIKLALSKVQKI